MQRYAPCFKDGLRQFEIGGAAGIELQAKSLVNTGFALIRFLLLPPKLPPPIFVAAKYRFRLHLKVGAQCRNKFTRSVVMNHFSIHSNLFLNYFPEVQDLYTGIVGISKLAKITLGRQVLFKTHILE